MVVYTPGFSGGEVTVPPSKSAAQRALFCAALSGGRCTVSNIDLSRDVEAALGAVKALGVSAVYEKESRSVFLDGRGLGTVASGTVDCMESGNTLRFFTPICAALGGEWRLTGSGRLPQRPMSVYRDLLPAHGVKYITETEYELPLKLSGRLEPGVFALPGDISSQFVTGLLLALPLLPGDSEIVLTSPLESAGYVELTLSMQREFGVAIEKTPDGYRVKGGRRYLSKDHRVEGDWSQAAFFLSMAALAPGGEKICIRGLRRGSLQGDRACVEHFGELGLETAWQGEDLLAWNPGAQKPYGGLRGAEIDVSQISDMLPALSVCAAFSQGETRFTHAGRLRLKESDRLSAMENAINALGGRAASTKDSLTVWGRETLPGGTAQGCNDHRVVMALAAAGLRCEGQVRVTDESSINKTYPGFFEDFKKLGGNAHVVHMG